MFTDEHIERYADVLIWGLKTARKGKFKKHDIILLQYEKPAIKLAEVLYEKLLTMGMHPIQRMGMTFKMEHSFYKIGDKKQLVFIPPGEKELYEKINGRIFLRAPESLTHLKDIDSKKIGTVLVSRKFLRDILDERENEGVYSWTLCTYPTEELARHAKATLKEYTEQIIKACYLDSKDPVHAWDEIHKNVKEIKKWLNSLKVKYLHIESTNIDLRITPGEKRQWKGVSGHNIPSFEIFFSPDWRGTEGTYFANLPSFRSGNYVEDVKLVFEKGVVTKIEAKEGREFIEKQLSMDKGANKVGEFSLTDKRFSRIDRFMADTLFDENFGGAFGNCHLAVGASYADTYAGNSKEMTKALKKKLGFNDSALHWDLVNTEDKTVTATLTTGKKMVIYEKGMFKY
ncbi:MAG TPA: aminopeptidase [Syntrophorhabdaceae bacterium]|nr:aminopeptidase [Syntrophorhabdaceae bacterium]HPP05808.1 aminopeptidase [Syntrophorhabdaceae bacterium]